MATYEIVLDRTAEDSAVDVVEDLPPAKGGEVLFRRSALHKGYFWRVDAIEPAQSGEADGRLIVSRTTDEPKPGTDQDVVGYSVEAVDGSCGRIDEASYETCGGLGYVVIDTSSVRNHGFGEQALIPAAAIDRADHANQTVFLTLTKEQLKNAPQYQRFDDAYRERVAAYYGPFLMAPDLVAPSRRPVERHG